MEIKRNITINLDEAELKDIIAKNLTEEGYEVEPQKVKFNIVTELEGYGTMEHEVTRFKGCSVTCEKQNQEKENTHGIKH